MNKTSYLASNDDLLFLSKRLFKCERLISLPNQFCPQVKSYVECNSCLSSVWSQRNRMNCRAFFSQGNIYFDRLAFVAFHQNLKKKDNVGRYVESGGSLNFKVVCGSCGKNYLSLVHQFSCEKKMISPLHQIDCLYA